MVFFILRVIGGVSFIDDYGLELFIHHYDSFVLDMLIPLSFTILLILVSGIIAESRNRFVKAIRKLLVDLSRYSIPIMSMHLFFAMRFEDAIGVKNQLLFVVVGVWVPYGVSNLVIRAGGKRWKALLGVK